MSNLYTKYVCIAECHWSQGCPCIAETIAGPPDTCLYNRQPVKWNWLNESDVAHVTVKREEEAE